MIFDAPEDLPNTPALTTLDVCRWDLHLTGSRYIGGHRVDSDWDFVTAVDPLLESFLLSAGFQESPRFNKTPGFNDGFTEAVYENEYRKVRVQVQFTNNLAAKLKARNALAISPSWYNAHLQASTATRIGMWKLLCTTAVQEGNMILLSPNMVPVMLHGVDWSYSVM